MSTDQTLVQLDSYYELNIKHLRWSFWSSLGALVAGLAALMVGIALIFRGNANLGSQLSVVAGVLTEFVGAGFFVLYNSNLKQLNIFYDKPIRHKDTLYAISLANQLDTEDKKSAHMAIIGNLLSRGEPPTSPDVLKAIINSKAGGTGA